MAIITRAKAKTFLQITDTLKDDLIDALIPQVEADYLLIRNRAFDKDSNDEIEYPDNAELVAAQMIGFLISDIARSGGAFKSESIGKYSYTVADMVAGYPKTITSRIDKYVGSK